jgi:hypothetical protein
MIAPTTTTVRVRSGLPALFGKALLPGETLRVQLDWNGEQQALENAIAGSGRIVIVPTAERDPVGRIGTIAERSD